VSDLAPLPERDCTVPDCLLRPMTAPSRASDGPKRAMHGTIDRSNKLRPDVLEFGLTDGKDCSANDSNLSVPSGL